MDDPEHGPRDEAWELFEAGRFEDALVAAEDLRAEDPDDPDAILLCAMARQELGEAEEALPLARRAAELVPHEETPRLVLASILFETCAFEEGLALVDGALEDGSRDPFAYHLRGLLCDLLGRRAEADAAFRKASRLDPET